MQKRGDQYEDADGDDTAVGGMRSGELTPKQREQQRRRQRALLLRSEGKSLTAIADELGWSSPSGVSYALKMARRELREVAAGEDLEFFRRLQFARYMDLFRLNYPLALGGMRNGVPVPPSLKHLRVVLRIMADMNSLMGLNGRPDEAPRPAPHSVTHPGTGGEAAPVMVIDFDMPQYEAARRRAVQQAERLASDEPIWVDDQPPAGYIRPRPGDGETEPELVALEPNSVDPETGEPIFDPRVALRSH